MSALGVCLLTLVAVQEPEAPGPRRGIDGIGGFEVTSSLVFEAAPDLAHSLTALYAFPDRARWRIGATGGEPLDRSLYFRTGTRVYGIEAGETASRAFDEATTEHTLLQMELRRAAFLYPHGFAWEEAEGLRRASVRTRSDDANSPVLGHLEAREEQGSLRLAAFDPDGEELEALEVLERASFGSRTWPRRLALWSEGERIWIETVRDVRTDQRFVDRFFVPPDRRRADGPAVAGRDLREVDLSPITYRIHELPEGTAWAAALARAELWIEAAREAGRAVDPVPCFELDAAGRPTRCLVRLAQALDDPPEGWTTRGEGPGLGVVLEGLAELDSGAIEALRGGAPEGERGGTPYCRVPTGPGARGVQLYLPLEPTRR